jgi:hypothetical protein
MNCLTSKEHRKIVATPLWSKCEDETHTPKSGNLESFGTSATSKLHNRGQNTSPSLERPWSGDVENGLAWAIWTFAAQVMAKRRADHKKLIIDPIPVCADGVRHTVGKNLRKVTSLLQTSSQSEVWTGSYEFSKSRESKPGQFRDSSLGVPGIKTIWMWVSQSNAENIIWGKVVASPESGPWWVKWVHGHPWLVPTPKVMHSQVPGWTHLRVHQSEVAERGTRKGAPDFQHYRGVEGRARSPGIKLGRRFSRSSLNLHQNKPRNG